VGAVIRLVELHEEGTSAPAQWNGKTDDGRNVYVRYRWGCLRVYVSHGDPLDLYPEGHSFEWNSDDDLDGVMGQSEMLERTREFMTFVR
jgi:hypothetical protein